jgi:hypothetical protein
MLTFLFLSLSFILFSQLRKGIVKDLDDGAGPVVVDALVAIMNENEDLANVDASLKKKACEAAVTALFGVLVDQLLEKKWSVRFWKEDKDAEEPDSDDEAAAAE